MLPSLPNGHGLPQGIQPPFQERLQRSPLRRQLRHRGPCPRGGASFPSPRLSTCRLFSRSSLACLPRFAPSRSRSRLACPQRSIVMHIERCLQLNSPSPSQSFWHLLCLLPLLPLSSLGVGTRIATASRTASCLSCLNPLVRCHTSDKTGSQPPPPSSPPPSSSPGLPVSYPLSA